MFDMPPPGVAVVVNVRTTSGITAQVGAWGKFLTLENKLQTLPVGALQDPFIRFMSAMAGP